MGKWNRRWNPRRKYYQEPPQPIHRNYYTESDSPGDWQSNVPTWERQFCSLVGSVPWGKVVVAKKYMHCHDNVAKWNDSAGEEAFNKAKERFRAAVNGLPCDIPLPDPDVYIDEIDWNPHIDPEMIMDLDRAYFNPDEGRDNTMHNSVSFHVVGWHGNLNNGDNKWEGSESKGTGASNDAAQGWNKWGCSTDESKILGNAKNPWEQIYNSDGALKDNAWGSCAEMSSGWNQGQTCNQQSNNFDSPWGRDCQNVGSSKETGWGNAVKNSWAGDPWKTNVHESRNFNNVDAPSTRTLHQGNGYGNNKGWGNCGAKNWGGKQWGNQINEPKYLDSRRNDGAWGALDGGCRKREGSHQYSPRYKSSRFQGDDYGTSHHWRKGRSQKRVCFS